jgi:hypothetical protein
LALPGFQKRPAQPITAALIRSSRRPAPGRCSGAAFPQKSLGLRKVQPRPEVGSNVLCSEECLRGILALRRWTSSQHGSDSRALDLDGRVSGCVEVCAELYKLASHLWATTWTCSHLTVIFALMVGGQVGGIAVRVPLGAGNRCAENRVVRICFDPQTPRLPASIIRSRR